MQRILILFTAILMACSNQEPKNTFSPQVERNDTLFTFFGPNQPKSVKPYRRDTTISDGDTSISKLTHGMAVSYYPNGKIKSKVNYKKGNRNGLAVMYYETGEKYVEETYKNGTLDGPKIKYYTTGQPIIKNWYTDGFISKSSVRYDIDGNIIPSPIIKYHEEDRRLQEGVYRLHIDLEKIKKLRKVTYYFTVKNEDEPDWNFEIESKKGVGYYDIPLGPDHYFVRKLNIVAKYTLKSGDVGALMEKRNLYIKPLF